MKETDNKFYFSISEGREVSKSLHRDIALESIEIQVRKERDWEI